MFSTETTEDLQRAARKAVRLHVAQYGHRDPAYLYDEVGQEVFCTFPRVADRVAERPTVYGPACQESGVAIFVTDDEGKRDRLPACCDHESCPAWNVSKPAPVILTRWAARDALRDVLSRDRHGDKVPDDVRARLAWERSHDETPGLPSAMRPADRGVVTAWHAEATAEVARESWHRIAGDLTKYPTLFALVRTSTDSVRTGGAAAWNRAAEIVAPHLKARQAHTVTKARGLAEWASLRNDLDAMRSVFAPDEVVNGAGPIESLSRFRATYGTVHKSTDTQPCNGAPEWQGQPSTAPLARGYVPANGVAVESLGTAPYYVTEDDTRAMDHRAETARVLATLGWPTSLAYAGRWAD